MKVTIKDYLNVRVGKSSLNAPTYQYLAPGSVIEIDGKTYKGDMFEGSDDWFRDAANNYYWAGGIHELYDYNRIVTGHIGKKLTGKGIKIAIIDSGIISTHTALKNIKYNADFSQSGTTEDNVGHGSHIAGIIAANDNSIRGIAPDAEIYNIKCNAQGDVYFSNLLSAIKDAIAQKVNVINISIGIFLKEVDIASITTVINDALSKGILVVASVGEDEFLSISERNFYPSGVDNCIAVGAISDTFFKSMSADFKFKKGLDYILPFKHISSCGINEPLVELRGSSMSTACISGWIALLMESGKTATEIIPTLDSFCKPLSEFKNNGNQKFSPYKPKK